MGRLSKNSVDRAGATCNVWLLTQRAAPDPPMSHDASPNGSASPCDVAFIGGGLANTLAAYRLAQRRPDLRLMVLEGGASLGGNHTWSFHTPDVSDANWAWFRPFVVHQWPDQDVAFPRRKRRLAIGYNSVTSERLHDTVMAAIGRHVRVGARVQAVDGQRITLADQSVIAAGAIIDGRGARPSPHLQLGYQKFLGLEIETATPHGVARPMIMDATVPQTDGYRFVYLLPFSPTRVLVEDTYYSGGSDLAQASLEARIDRYCEARGWRGYQIIRREHGILPIALAGDIAAYWDEAGALSPARSGLAAALFHPTTGYSLPDAVRFADALASQSDMSGPAIAAFSRAYAVQRWDERGFYRFLNRMLFVGARPNERVGIFERFYGLQSGLIARFYAAENTSYERGRILFGKPPIPISRGLKCISPRSAVGGIG